MEDVKIDMWCLLIAVILISFVGWLWLNSPIGYCRDGYTYVAEADACIVTGSEFTTEKLFQLCNFTNETNGTYNLIFDEYGKNCKVEKVE